MLFVSVMILYLPPRAGQSITDYYLPVSTSLLPPIGRPSLSTPPPPTRGVPGPSDLLE